MSIGGPAAGEDASAAIGDGRVVGRRRFAAGGQGEGEQRNDGDEEESGAANGEFFHLMEISFGGIPGRPIGDGMDAHSWWPLFENIPNEYLETYYPLTVLEYGSLMDSGGAGFHRGGNGVHKVYRFEADGEIATHDDRQRSQPWGILGGLPGNTSSETLIRVTGEARFVALQNFLCEGTARRCARLPDGGWRRMERSTRPAPRISTSGCTA